MFARHRNRVLAYCALLLMILLASSCSEKITSAGERSIDLEIWTSLEASGGAAQASRFVLTVTGPGILEPIVARLTLASGGLLIGSVSVPAGPARVFTIDAYDEAGVLLYSGRTVADVLGGRELRLDIDLVPQVPMIKVSPSYLETIQGDILAMKIQVCHLPDAASLRVKLSNIREVRPSSIEVSNIVVDPQLAKVADWEIIESYYTAELEVSLRNPADRLVDENGFAEIATVYYQTYMYEIYPLESATFTPLLVSMHDRSGGALPLDGIRAENAVVILYDYWARYVAFWDMSTGDIFANIADLSDNNLDGIAVGTAPLDGALGGLARLFNGSSDYVTVPDNALLDLQEEITISMWIYLPVGAATPNPLSSLICKRNLNGAINYQLLLEDVSSTDGYKSLLFRYGSSGQNVYRVDVPDNESIGWFHVLFSYRFGEPSSAMMVIGYGCVPEEYPGVWISGTGREPAPNTSGALFLARDNASAACYFDGGLDEVELFDIAWTWDVVWFYLFTGCR